MFPLVYVIVNLYISSIYGSLSVTPVTERFSSLLSVFGSESGPITPNAQNNLYLNSSLVSGQNNYVVYGKEGGYSYISLNSFGNSSDFVELRPSEGGIGIDSTSRSSMPVGDINHDGHPDYIVCYPTSSVCYIYLGNGNSNFFVFFSFSLFGETAGDGFGWSVAGLGDINGDTYDDIAILAKNSRIVYVIYGSSSVVSSSFAMTSLASSTGFRIIGSYSTFEVSMVVSAAGDFNNDGYRDIVLSALRAQGEGIIYVIYGKGSRPGDVFVDSLTIHTGFYLYSSLYSFAGISLAGIGDLNHDGYDDLAIGSMPYRGSYEGGCQANQRTFIVYGRNSSLNPFLNDLTVSEMTVSDGFLIDGGGFMVSTIGDVNDDGIEDVFLSSFYNWQESENGNGNAYLMFYLKNDTGRVYTYPPSGRPSTSPTQQPGSPSSSPSALPTTLPTIVPTSQPTGLDTVRGLLITSLDSSIVGSINILVSSTEDQISSYLIANVIISMVKAIEADPLLVSSSQTIQDYRDSIFEATECSLFFANGSLSLSSYLVAAATYSAIRNENDAIAYLNSTSSSFSSSFHQTPEYSLNHARESCISLLEKQLNITINETALAAEGLTIFSSDSSGGASVDDDSSSGCASDIDIIYINGICAFPDEIASSSNYLKSFVSDNSTFNNMYAFINPTFGLQCVDKLKAIFQQKLIDNGDSSTIVSRQEALQYYLSLAILRSDHSVISSPIQLSPFFGQSWTSTAMTEVSQELALMLTPFSVDSTISNQLVRQIQDSIFHGRAVTIISHSSGNFYMNNAYSQLSTSDKSYVRLISVAAPNSYIGSNGVISPYVTRNDDAVITSLIAAPNPSVLPTNTIPVHSYSYSLNYFMLEAYLLDSSPAIDISDKLTTLLSVITYPNNAGGTGAITVTLTWGSQPDVDLHVTEPDGFHVSYSHKTGHSGSLDVDDTDSYGPENYFVDFNTLSLGVYTVGINYYEGNAPETAHIAIKTCTLVREYDKVLPSEIAQDVAGFQIATITVSHGSSGKLKFDIQSL
jgi:hypothetical protein